MNMNEFNEKFPSLNKLRISVIAESPIDVGFVLDDLGEYIQISDVYKYCLDKQKVRDAIFNIFGKTDSNGEKRLRTTGEDANSIYLLEELGL